MQCSHCSQPISGANAQFCNHCGAPIRQVQTIAAPTYILTPAVPQARKHIRSGFDVQLRQAPNGPQTQYYSSHQETYAVLDEQNGWYELRLGGGETGWLEAKYCADIANVAGDLSLPIPAVLMASGSTHVWAVFEPMPLAQIGYDSDDYHLMYQWIGAPAAHPPTMAGYVRSYQQLNVQTINQSASYRRSDTEVRTIGVSETITSYQMTVEDGRGSRRTVMFEQPPVKILPQVGDYLVIWGAVNQNGVCTMVQSIRRDLRDPSNGSVLVPLGTVERKGPPFNWVPALVFVALLVLLWVMFRFLR